MQGSSAGRDGRAATGSGALEPEQREPADSPRHPNSRTGPKVATDAHPPITADLAGAYVAGTVKAASAATRRIALNAACIPIEVQIVPDRR